MDSALVTADDQTELLDSLGFLEFLQIFFLGDYYLLASFMPKITRGLISLEFSNPIDQFVEEPGRTSDVYGNPLKNTMLIQTLRYMPIVLSAPTIIIFGMVFVDLVILTKFVLHKLDKGDINNFIKEEMELKTGKSYELQHIYVDSPIINVNKRQDDSNLERIERSDNARSYDSKVEDRFCDILVSVCAKLIRLTRNPDEKNLFEGQEYNVSGESYPNENRLGNEIDAPIEDQAGDIDKDLRLLRTNLADLFPTVGVSFGTIIGMLFSYSFWGSLGVGPFGVITILAGMLGRSISLFLDGIHFFFM